MSDGLDLDPFELSRKLALTAGRQTAFVRALRLGAVGGDPFLGELFPGKTIWDQVQRSPLSDPLRTPLLRWIHFLTVERIVLPLMREEAHLAQGVKYDPCDCAEAPLSLIEFRERALLGPVHQAEGLWRCFGRHERPLAAHRRHLFSTRQEASARLGSEDAACLFHPLSDQEGDASDLARLVLERTQDLAGNLLGRGWEGSCEAACARGASAGWPARLAPDTLRSLLGERELYKNLSLTPPALPSRLNPMSFVRAGAAIGRSLRSALVTSELPFVVAEDPYDVLREEAAQLVALWMTSPTFGRRKLGLPSEDVRAAQRAWIPAWVAQSRLMAARVLVLQAARRGRDDLLETFAPITERAFGCELHSESAMGRFTVGPDAEFRLVAWLAAWGRELALVNEFDEDWYLNPRAQEMLRDEWSGPAQTTRSAAACRAGIERLLRRSF